VPRGRKVQSIKCELILEDWDGAWYIALAAGGYWIYYDELKSKNYYDLYTLIDTPEKGYNCLRNLVLQHYGITDLKEKTLAREFKTSGIYWKID